MTHLQRVKSATYNSFKNSRLEEIEEYLKVLEYNKKQVEARISGALKARDEALGKLIKHSKER